MVQLYLSGGAGDITPIRTLRGFQRVHLRAGESRQVSFTVPTADLPKASTEVSVGSGQPLAGTPHITGSL